MLLYDEIKVKKVMVWKIVGPKKFVWNKILIECTVQPNQPYLRISFSHEKIVYAWLWMIWCHGNPGVLLSGTSKRHWWTRPPLSHWYSIICKNVMTRRTIPSQEESLKSTWWTTSRLLNKGQTVKEKNLSNNKLRRKKMSLVFKYIPHIWRKKTSVKS